MWSMKHVWQLGRKDLDVLDVVQKALEGHMARWHLQLRSPAQPNVLKEGEEVLPVSAVLLPLLAWQCGSACASVA